MNGLGKEIMLCKARLAEEKSQRERKLERVDAAVTVIREIIDPYDLNNISSWDMEKFKVIAEDVYVTWMEIRQHDRRIGEMEKDLGHG